MIRRRRRLCRSLLILWACPRSTQGRFAIANTRRLWHTSTSTLPLGVAAAQTPHSCATGLESRTRHTIPSIADGAALMSAQFGRSYHAAGQDRSLPRPEMGLDFLCRSFLAWNRLRTATLETAQICGDLLLIKSPVELSYPEHIIL